MIRERKTLNKIFSYIGKGLTFQDYFNSNTVSGTYQFFFRSKIDSSIQKTNIYLPQNYNNQKKYSLVLILDHRNLIFDSSINEKKLLSFYQEHVIISLVSLRGITTGSYIGEAAVLESLNYILRVYHFGRHLCTLGRYQ
jgi:hypothetical protein